MVNKTTFFLEVLMKLYFMFKAQNAQLVISVAHETEYLKKKK